MENSADPTDLDLHCFKDAASTLFSKEDISSVSRTRPGYL